MRMKPEHSRRLFELSNRGNNDPLISLIIARRAARHLCAEADHDREHFKRAVMDAEAGLPFTATKVADLEDEHEKRRAVRRKNFLAIADWMLRVDDYLTSVYGMETILDVLAVNPVHRAEAAEYACEARSTLSGIAWVAGLEDSASTKSGRNQPDWKNGPLFNVFQKQFMEFLIDKPGAFPDPFAPGGPFYGMPAYYKQPDGSMARKSASLTVHEQNGSSRVVERNIEVKRP
ncbi:hypothetical protein [Pseudomonas sp. LS-2]|uniref:hypothetical protein n=1 Tax=Pseudomonas sp. LS-2 TaxID=2315859 RepID=UPI000E7112DA|nr:hypothetical protein [Pseudomonas sp. LS-2]RJX81301.1 hypothetical protein D3M70_09155 [Pseudomonas sp. LS-2]